MTKETVSDPSTTARALIEGGVCPPWLVPSQPLFGRCVPFFYQDAGGDNVTEESVRVEAAETPTGESVTGKVLRQAVKKIVDVLNLRSFGERILADLCNSWWMILIALFVATVISFLWIYIMR